MAEFMRLAGVKQKVARAAAGIVEPMTKAEGDAIADDLMARGIIDEKGVVRGG